MFAVLEPGWLMLNATVFDQTLLQHQLSDQIASAAQLEQEFGDRVAAIGCILPFLNPWFAPKYGTRLWW